MLRSRMAVNSALASGQAFQQQVSEANGNTEVVDIDEKVNQIKRILDHYQSLLLGFTN